MIKTIQAIAIENTRCRYANQEAFQLKWPSKATALEKSNHGRDPVGSSSRLEDQEFLIKTCHVMNSQSMPVQLL